jgi:poly(3-hydroxybutyrate) depolymerase
MRTRLIALLCLAFATMHSGRAAAQTAVHTLTFSYHARSGALRTAYLVLPSWYGPRRHPTIPLVISPHGRGVDGAYNLRFWGALPARGPFALVSPDGAGRRLPLYSWGYAGQIDDLARMPSLVRAAFPWLTLDRSRIYAIGDSMGGQEVLLLGSRHHVHLAGIAAFDPVTDMAIRYRTWQRTPSEQQLPALARIEFGGTPRQETQAYRARSPAAYLGAIARSGIALQLWWSHRDAVITDQPLQTASFYRRLVATAPRAPVQEIVGYWEHAHEMHPDTQLPAALACFHLIPSTGIRIPAYAKPAPGGGPIAELPPSGSRADVPFSRSFCGAAGR